MSKRPFKGQNPLKGRPLKPPESGDREAGGRVGGLGGGMIDGARTYRGGGCSRGVNDGGRSGDADGRPTERRPR